MGTAPHLRIQTAHPLKPTPPQLPLISPAGVHPVTTASDADCDHRGRARPHLARGHGYRTSACRGGWIAGTRGFTIGRGPLRQDIRKGKWREYFRCGAGEERWKAATQFRVLRLEFNRNGLGADVCRFYFWPHPDAPPVADIARRLPGRPHATVI